MFSTFAARPVATSTVSATISCLAPCDFHRQRDGVLADLRGRQLRAGHDVDAALLETALHFARRVLVLEWKDARHRFDQRDLRAERVEHIGELAADGARADDRDGLGRLLENQRFVRRDHRRLVQLEAGLRQAAHARARARSRRPWSRCALPILPSSIVTFTDLFGASVPVPLIQVILFFLNRNSTPFEFFVLTSRERFIATP